MSVELNPTMSEKYFLMEILKALNEGGTTDPVDPVVVEAWNEQIGNTYAPVESDIGKTIRVTSGSAVAFNLPPDSFPIGTILEVCKGGSGKITFTSSGGTVLESFGGALRTTGQHALATLKKRTSTTWLVTGQLEV
jgi:hypothetical protein